MKFIFKKRIITGGWVKAERERKIMVCSAGEPVQDVNPVEWEERHPAEEPHCGSVNLVLGKRVTSLFVSKSTEILLL